MSSIKRTPYNIMKSAVDCSFEPTPEEIKKINSFFLVRFVSNDPATIYIANELNCMHTIPIEAQYKFIKYSTLDKVAFINYPKKEKIPGEEYIKVIMIYYKVNRNVALEYLKILGKDKAEELYLKYKNMNNGKAAILK